MKITKITLLALLSAASVAATAAPPDERQVHIDKAFAALDVNGDGRIDKAEFSRFQQARFDEQAKTVEAAVKELDKDRDGKVSKVEAAEVPDLAKYFDALDTDKDGFLSLEEMKRAMIAVQTVQMAGPSPAPAVPK